jgi:iron complex transport system permease protein
VSAPPLTSSSAEVRLSGQTLRTRSGRLSIRLDTRATVLTGVLLLLTLGIGTLSLTSGDFPVPVGDVIRSLTGRGDTGTDFIVLTLRLPRVVAALLVGAALGVSGAIFQRLTNNPLGSPDFIGLTVGASSGALIVILVLNGGAPQVALGALLGCALTSLAIYLLAYRGGVQGFRLILIGIGVSAMPVVADERTVVAGGEVELAARIAIVDEQHRARFE